MAITIPTEYAKWQGRSGEVNNYIVKLTNTGTAWLLGDFASGNAWTDDPVHSLLASKVNIKQKIDPINHDPSRATVSLTLSNSKDYKTNSVRIIDEIGDIVGHGASVYHMNSPYANSLTDCLQIFSGSTQSIKDSDESKVKLKLEDNGFTFDQRLLTNTISSFYPESGITPIEEQKLTAAGKIIPTKVAISSKKVPKIYGQFTRYDTGLAKGWYIGNGLHLSEGVDGYEYIFSDWFFNAGIDGPELKLYIVVGSDIPPVEVTRAEFHRFLLPATTTAFMIGTHLTTKDDDTGPTEMSEVFALNPIRVTPYDADIYNNRWPSNAVDPADINSEGFIVPYFWNEAADIGSGFDTLERTGEFMFSITRSAQLEALMRGSSLPAELRVRYINMRVPTTYAFTSHNPTNAQGHSHVYAKIYYNVINSQGQSIGKSPRLFLSGGFQSSGEVLPIAQRDSTYYDSIERLIMNSGHVQSVEQGNATWWFGLEHILDRYDYTGSADNPTTPAHLEPMLALSNVELVLNYTIDPEEETSGAAHDAGFAYAQCRGRVYGSWVTNMHSGGTQQLSSTVGHVREPELIDEGAGIIASLLIDELSIGTDEIDWPSFIDSVAIMIRSRYNLLEEDITLGDVIKDLCHQGMFTYAWTAAGKMRLIPLRTANISNAALRIAGTVKYEDLTSKGIRVRKTDVDEVVNHITVKSRWWEEEQRFVDTDVYENTTSQAKYGVRKRELEFKNITTGDELAIVTNPVKALMLHLIEPDKVNGTTDANHLVDDGYWSSQRDEIEFEVVGSKFKHVEVGDYIRVDGTTVDPHIKLFGSSWTSGNGNNFVVTSMSNTDTGNKIVAEKVGSFNSIFEMRSLGILSP